MPPQELVQNPVTEPVPFKMGKFKASKLIVKESWAILRQDKEIMWFPVVSAIVGTIVLAIMAAIFYFLSPSTENLSENQSSVVFYLGIFVYYVVMIFIVNFFQSGVFIVAHARFSGQDLGFKDGINGAKNNVGKIFMWSVIMATVGIILDFIANRSKIIGKVVAWLLGAAWNILTYFSLPSLVIGQTSVRESFKESASIIRKTWGETIIINFGVSLFFGVLIMLSFVVGIVAVVVVPTYIMMVCVLVLFLIFVIMVSIVSSTLNSIFKLALYEYARTGVVPQGFSPEIIRNAVNKK